MATNRRRWIPWRLQVATSWLLANRYLVFALLRFRFKPPRCRILISSAFFGGVGGVEKLLKTVIESMPDSMFYVAAREVRTEGFLPRTHNYVVNYLPRRGMNLDLYVYFAGGGLPPYLGDDYTFTTSIIDTCGANITNIEGKFDWIAIQTGNAEKYSRKRDKWILAFPSMHLTFPARRKAIDLPERYFVSVFNPYSDKLKGSNTLFRAAEHAAFPIVWCYNDKTGLKFDDPGVHPNIIRLKNLTQEELYYVYEHATAYISFSFSEGLGWAIAEAFYIGLPIISREVGFVTYVKSQRGVHIYQTESELFSYVSDPAVDPSEYDYSYLNDNSFEKVIHRLLCIDSATATKSK